MNKLDRIITLLESIAESLKEEKTIRTLQTKKTSFDFNELWKDYPNKDGRKSAERSFNASVLSEKDFADIKIALTNYLKSEKVLKGFVKNGSTWFNNWRDWIEYKEEKKYATNDERILAKLRAK